MAGNKNSGRKKKTESKYKFPVIESFTLNGNKHFGLQLKDHLPGG